jgi:acylphosphatase
MTHACYQGYVSGRVQGVWYRNFVREQAAKHGLGGWAKNLADGRVEVLLCGAPQAIEAVIAAMHIGPPAAQVSSVQVQPTDQYEPVGDFSIA